MKKSCWDKFIGKLQLAKGAGGLALAIFEFYLLAGLIHLLSMAIPDMKISRS